MKVLSIIETKKTNYILLCYFIDIENLDWVFWIETYRFISLNVFFYNLLNNKLNKISNSLL